jgi:hypothetical protein
MNCFASEEVSRVSRWQGGKVKRRRGGSAERLRRSATSSAKADYTDFADLTKGKFPRKDTKGHEEFLFFPAYCLRAAAEAL